MNERTNQSGGVGALSLLGVLFIGLKLCGVIDWSWWYVLLPLYGMFALALGLAIIGGVFMVVGERMSK